MSDASEKPAIPEDVQTLATAVAGTFGWGYFQVQARDAIAKAIMLDRAARPVDTGREKALEEAARVAEGEARAYPEGKADDEAWKDGFYFGAMTAAFAIRALASQKKGDGRG